MKKFSWFKQLDSMDCGPTCLKMIGSHYGKNLNLEKLRTQSQIGKEGVNLLGISEAAESVGFNTRSVKLDYTTLTSDAKLPAIIHWNQNHFVVLYKVKKNKLFIADPAKGLLEYSAPDFKWHWISDKENGVEEGVALLLEPSQRFFEARENGQKERKFYLNNVFRYLLPYRKMLGQLLLGLIVASLLQLLLPFLTKSMVDTGINSGSLQFIYIVLFAQLALFSGRLMVEFVRNWILLHISTRINVAILTDFLVKLMKLPVHFFDSKKTGDILQRMNDHSRIDTFLTGSSLNTLFSLLNLLILSVTLAVFNIYLFIVFIISSIFYVFWVVLFLRKRRTLDYRQFEVAATEQSTTIQLVQGMQEIKLNGVERPMRWQWERLKAKLFKLSVKGLALNQWQQTGAFFINEGKNIIITFISAKAVIDGQMTLGSMLAVQYIIGQLNSPVEQMINFVQSWQNAKISIERLNEVHMQEDEEPGNRAYIRELPPSYTRQLAGGADNSSFIHLHNIHFTYPGAGNEPVLQNISFSIPKGKTTAIVGVSGSGKTTLIKLLLKFYEPQKGDIKINNAHLSDVSHRVWRSHCGVVMQESFIFSDTIARNIAVGDAEIDTQRLFHAVSVSCIGDFIDSLPLGLNTRIGPDGIGISMGQRQRILIARAVYRNPEFMFLDEATNSLDANNESAIVKKLALFLQGKTVVVVAHRLSTVKKADQIVVLNNGMIAEMGTHQQLVNRQGEYFRLIKNQLELGN